MSRPPSPWVQRKATASPNAAASVATGVVARAILVLIVDVVVVASGKPRSLGCVSFV